MDGRYVRGVAMSAEPSFFEQFGTYLVAGTLGAIGWVMNTFTSRHLEAMDKLTSKVGALSEDVASIKTDLSATAQRQDELALRLTRLEDHERQR